MKYLFRTRFEGTTDAVVLDLPSERGAWREAVSAAGDALLDIDGHMGLPDHWIMHVTDERGHALFELKVMTRRLRED